MNINDMNILINPKVGLTAQLETLYIASTRFAKSTLFMNLSLSSACILVIFIWLASFKAEIFTIKLSCFAFIAIQRGPLAITGLCLPIIEDSSTFI